MVVRYATIHEDELNRISELLCIAKSSLLYEAKRLAIINPEADIIKRMRHEARYCAELVARIKRR